MTRDGDRDLYARPIRPHVLHYPVEEPVYGVWIVEELRRHGYGPSPGALHPWLHGPERKSYLASRPHRTGQQERPF